IVFSCGWRRAGALVPAATCLRFAERGDQGCSTTGPALLHSPCFYLLVQIVDPAALEVLVGDEQPVLERGRTGLPRYQLHEQLAHLVDRKSTRLNSSHGS